MSTLSTVTITALDADIVNLSAGSVMNLDDSGLYSVLNGSIVAYTVTGNFSNIRDGMFFGCNKLNKLTLSATISKIGKYAFCDCRSLQSITIPSAVTSIGNYAFKDCVNLNKVYFYSYIDDIGVSIFDGCSSLKDVWVPWSKNMYDDSWIPNGVTIHYNTMYDYNTGLPI